VAFDTPPDGEVVEEGTYLEYTRQRTGLSTALNGLYAIAPVPVEPLIGPKGELYALGSLDEGSTPAPLDIEQVQKTLDTTKMERWDIVPQLAIYATLKSDARAGCPNKNLGSDLDGVRLWPVPPKAMKDLQFITTATNLANEFPTIDWIGSDHDKHVMNFAALRKRYMEMLGKMPEIHLDDMGNVPADSELEIYLKKSTTVPFAPAWMRYRTKEAPNGIERHGKWVMHPLVFNNGLERQNRVFGCPSPEYQLPSYKELVAASPGLSDMIETRMQVIAKTQALKQLSGQKRKTQAADATRIAELECELKAWKRSCNQNNERIKQQSTEIDQLKQELDKSKKEARHLCITDGQKLYVDFAERDGKADVRWKGGKVFVNGEEVKMFVGQESKLTIRYENEEDQASPAFMEAN